MLSHWNWGIIYNISDNFSETIRIFERIYFFQTIRRDQFRNCKTQRLSLAKFFFFSFEECRTRKWYSFLQKREEREHERFRNKICGWNDKTSKEYPTIFETKSSEFFSIYRRAFRKLASRLIKFKFKFLLATTIDFTKKSCCYSSNLNFIY